MHLISQLIILEKCNMAHFFGKLPKHGPWIGSYQGRSEDTSSVALNLRY